MAKVYPYYTGAEAAYFFARLPFRERSTWNHHGFQACPECL